MTVRNQVSTIDILFDSATSVNRLNYVRTPLPLQGPLPDEHKMSSVQPRFYSQQPHSRRSVSTMNQETISLSRATSVSRASKQGSTVSRNQSLIKKNVAPHDLRPSDVLIARFVAWKAIVKQLIAYFEVRSLQRRDDRKLTPTLTGNR